MKTIFTFFCIVSIISLFNTGFAQKQASNWTLPDSIQIDFTDGENPIVSFVPLPIPIGLIYNECNATYSDENGNLLVYFIASSRVYNDGQEHFTCKLLDKNNQLLINGDSLRGDPDFTNGAIFLPFKDKDNKKKLYLFTLSFSNIPNWVKHAFYYNIIDLAEKKVIVKNKELYSDSSSSLPPSTYNFDEKLAAVRHTNGVDWWLMGYDRNESAFLRWRVTPSGILGPFSQNIGTYAPDSILSSAIIGEMTFNPQGTRLAIVSGAGVFDLFSFDRCTGLLFDWVPLINPGVDYNNFDTGLPYSTEFSPNGKVLYLATADSLFQFDLTAPNIRATQTTLAVIPEQGVVKFFGQIQLAPNGKIYITNYRHSATDTADKFLSVIQYPDSVGLGCQFVSQGLYLKGKKCNIGLPNMPAYLPGAIAPDIPQANAGLPERFLCPGDSVLLGAPALPGAVYRWRPAVGLSDTTVAMPFAKPDITTTYTLWVSDSAQNICTQTVALTKVSIPQFPTGFSVAIDAFLATFTVNTDIGATHKKYQWKFGDNVSLTKTYPIAYHTYQDTGTYFVNLTIIDTLSGCEKTFSDTLIIKVSQKSGIYTSNTTSFNLYPNPANEIVTLEHDYENATVEIFTPLGKIVHTQNAPKPKTTIDLRRLAKGIYYVRLVTNLNQILLVKKLIIY